jgi:hypothetical protein
MLKLILNHKSAKRYLYEFPKYCIKALSIFGGGDGTKYTKAKQYLSMLCDLCEYL